MGKTPRDYLSEESKAALKGSKVVFVEDEEKYTKDQYLSIYKGYDFLENLYVVRIYIQKRYKIEWGLLELLLKLMAIKVFSRSEYASLPKKKYTYRRLSSVMESGYINMVSNHADTEQRLYSLSTKGRNIVINFYQHLSGEKKIPTDAASNPMAKKSEQVNYDKKKMALIEKLNELPMKPHFKRLL